MKKRLYLKLLIGYVIFGILGFILVSTFSSHYTYEYIEDTEVDRLYKEANMIASTYASNYFNEDITVDDLHDSLATLSTYLSSEIWVMNTDGDILINSNASVSINPNKVFPQTKKYVVMAGLLGAVLVCGVLVLAHLLHDTIVDDEDIQKKLGLPVLGLIPEV